MREVICSGLVGPTQGSKILDIPDDKCHLEPTELQAYFRAVTNFC